MPFPLRNVKSILGILLLGVLAGCTGTAAGAATIATMAPPVVTTDELTPTPQGRLQDGKSAQESRPPGAITVWVSAAVPPEVRDSLAYPAGVIFADRASGADFILDVLPGGEERSPVASSRWVYALAAPFPTIPDGVSIQALKSAWRGNKNILPVSTLLVAEDTRQAFAQLWGEPDKDVVQVAPQEDLLERAWSDTGGWAILPFDQLEPRWKVERVSGLSPLDKDFDLDSYPLTVTFGVTGGWAQAAGENLPADMTLVAGNRDPDRLTVVVLTGTTALVRTTALKIEEEGIQYPLEDIRDWLAGADVTHISNEVPFYSDCPPAKPLRREMRFCSDPSYFELLEEAGTDVVELTGNHVLDWGADAFRETLQLYREHNLPYYGGGEDLQDARKPYLVEHNGNRLAFLGCNPVGPENIWATADQPGAASCDMDWMVAQIQQLRADGYLPIVTFQHLEVEDFRIHSAQRTDFRRMAAAGAVIVSGSQSHFPQAMSFVDDHFIHYGLGNLFFDQMTTYNRQEFIDRHVFYDGRYIGTELLTAILEDYARPRPMTAGERSNLLEKVFEVSEW
ncbi:MAG: CapA family protein [Anaerolineaceae bacterium]|nr:CapA family protein [Anaerolineaceae bacterium]